MFTTGGLISPLLARPFLLEREESDEPSSTNSSYFNETLITNSTKVPFEYSPDDVLVQWPFTVVGIVFILAAIGFFVFYYFIPSEPSNPIGVNKSLQNNLPTETRLGESAKLDRLPSADYRYNFDNKVKIMIIVIISIFSHIYFGVVISFGK